MFYVVYIDTYSNNTCQKLYKYFQKKDITIVFALSASYKGNDVPCLNVSFITRLCLIRSHKTNSQSNDVHTN